MDETTGLAILASASGVIGAVVGGVIAQSADTRRWRREHLSGQIRDLREFAAVAVAAADAQFVMLGALGAPSLDTEDQRRARVRETDQRWREALGRRVVSALPELQSALASFDKSRARTVEFMNAHDVAGYKRSLIDLEAARLAILDGVQITMNEINRELASHVLGRPERLWAVIRRRSPVPIAKLPSEMAADDAGP